MDSCTLSTCPARQSPGAERRSVTPSPSGKNTITEMLQNELKKKECLLKHLIDDYESLRFKYCSIKQEFKSFKEVYRQLELDNGKLMMEKKKCISCQEGIVASLKTELEHWKAQNRQLQDKIPTNGDVKRRIENIENLILSQNKILSEIYQHDMTKKLSDFRCASTVTDSNEYERLSVENKTLKEQLRQRKTHSVSTTTNYATAEKSTHRGYENQETGVQTGEDAAGASRKKTGASMIPLRTDKPTSTTNYSELQDVKREYSACKEKNAQLTEQVKSLKRDLQNFDELEQENFNLKMELTRLTEDTCEQISSLQAKITQLEEHDNDRKVLLEAASVEMDRIKRVIQDTPVEGHPQLEESFVKLTQSLRRLTTEVEGDREKAKNLKNLLNQQQTLMKEKAGPADLQDTIRKLQAELARKQHLITELEHCVDQTNDVLDECECTVKDLTEENAQLRAEKDALDKEWREKYNDLIKINENLMEELDNLETVEQTVHFLTEQFTMLLEQIKQMSRVISALANSEISPNRNSAKVTATVHVDKGNPPDRGAKDVSSNPNFPNSGGVPIGSSGPSLRTDTEERRPPTGPRRSSLKTTAHTPRRHSIAFVGESPSTDQPDFSIKKDSRGTNTHHGSADVEQEINVIHLDRSFGSPGDTPVYSFERLGGPATTRPKSQSSLRPSGPVGAAQRAARSVSEATIRSDYDAASTGSEPPRKKPSCLCTGTLLCKMKCDKCKVRYKQLLGGENFDPDSVTYQHSCKTPERVRRPKIRQLEAIKNDVAVMLTDNNLLLKEVLDMLNNTIRRLKAMDSSDPEVRSVKQEVVESLSYLEKVLTEKSQQTQPSKQCQCCDCMDVLSEMFCQQDNCRYKRKR